MIYNPYLAYQQVRPNYAAAAQAPEAQPYFGIKGRPVASIDEARAMSIDFDGSIFYFPDLANNKIYTKQINMDGTASLNIYELKEMPVVPEVDVSQYVTREELAAALAEFKAGLVPATPPAAKKEVPPINF